MRLLQEKISFRDFIFYLTKDYIAGIGNTMSCLGGIISPMITSKIVVQVR